VTFVVVSTTTLIVSRLLFRRAAGDVDVAMSMLLRPASLTLRRRLRLRYDSTTTSPYR